VTRVYASVAQKNHRVWQFHSKNYMTLFGNEVIDYWQSDASRRRTNFKITSVIRKVDVIAEDNKAFSKCVSL
jgi:hypothetical protein